MNWIAPPALLDQWIAFYMYESELEKKALEPGNMQDPEKFGKMLLARNRNG